MNDYFTAEARRHLAEMDDLLDSGTAEAVPELLRLARAFRGSAHMAGAETVERVAERLEHAATAVLEGQVAWSGEIRELARQTVGDLRVLLRALNRWGAQEEQRVREAIDRWDDLRGETDAPQLVKAVEPRPSGVSERALRDAVALRPVLEELLRRDAEPDPEIAGVVDELFALVSSALHALRSDAAP